MLKSFPTWGNAGWAPRWWAGPQAEGPLAWGTGAAGGLAAAPGRMPDKWV